MKSEEFERALSDQHTPAVPNSDKRLALAVLALLDGDEGESARAGEGLQELWVQTRT